MVEKTTPEVVFDFTSNTSVSGNGSKGGTYTVGNGTTKYRRLTLPSTTKDTYVKVGIAGDLLGIFKASKDEEGALHSHKDQHFITVKKGSPLHEKLGDSKRTLEVVKNPDGVQALICYKI